MFIDLHWGQSSHLALGEVEPDAGRDILDGTYGDGNPLLAPEVAFVKEHMGDAMVIRVDDQPPDPPDFAVGGEDVLPPAHLHLTQRYRDR